MYLNKNYNKRRLRIVMNVIIPVYFINFNMNHYFMEEQIFPNDVWILAQTVESVSGVQSKAVAFTFVQMKRMNPSLPQPPVMS